MMVFIPLGIFSSADVFNMAAPNALTLLDPQSKALAFSVYTFQDDTYFNKPANYNYFSMLLISKGSGTVVADVAEYSFTANSLVCFSLYQPFMFRADDVFEGTLINFHPDFFCLHKHRNEVSCNGVLFNNIYHSPVIYLDKEEMESLAAVATGLKTEMQHNQLAQHEVLISYLKIFLINATRIKLRQQQDEDAKAAKEPIILDTLKYAIEQHFKKLHSPGDYAGLLHISTRALNRISKTHFNKTLTTLIAERIITEAKRELYLSSKPIKQIAYELGFNDEFYFSRFFKSNVAVSPQIYRDTIGFDRASA
jgi:AraC family transcriptional activator of pobA